MKRRHTRAYKAAINPDNVHWTQLRWARYRHQKGRCAVCHLPLGFYWELHHMSYRNLGKETLPDVRCVHRMCHRIADQIRRIKERKKR